MKERTGFPEESGDEAMERTFSEAWRFFGMAATRRANTVHLCGGCQHHPMSLADPSVLSGASVLAVTTFGDPADPGLEELVGRDPEEIGHAVKILDLHIAVAVEDFVDPRLVVFEPTGERGRILGAGAKERLDVLAKDVLRVHLLGNSLFHTRVGVRPLCPILSA